MATFHQANTAFCALCPAREVSSDGAGKGGNSIHEIFAVKVGRVFNRRIEFLIVGVDSRD